MATFPGLRTGKSAALLAILAIAISGTLSAGRNQDALRKLHPDVPLWTFWDYEGDR